MKKKIFTIIILLMFSLNNCVLANETSPKHPKLWKLQWDMQEITNDGKSYKLSEGSHKTTVGIIDSGIKKDHPDLKMNVQGAKNFVPKGGINGKETYETGKINQTDDLTGHGTSVAGQVAANGYMKGVAPNVGIKSYRAFSGRGVSKTEWICNAIKSAADDNVDVINISSGEYLINGSKKHGRKTDNQDQKDIAKYKKAISYAYKKGSIIVASYGNDSINIDNSAKFKEKYSQLNKNIKFNSSIIDAPAQLDHVIGVASTNKKNSISHFTNYSDNIDIFAPGADDLLLLKYGKDFYNNKMQTREQLLTTSVNGHYMYSYGNSLSTPKVSGTLALIIEKYNYKDSPTKSIEHLKKYGYDNYKDIHSKKNINVLNTYRALSQNGGL
ncbi:S8 family peptidase [Staphylococcus hominis]|jgi:subtilisin family serine protease